MSLGIKMRQFQITLLELYAAGRELNQEFSSYKPYRPTLGWTEGHSERRREADEKSIRMLHRRIGYLKRLGYIQRVRENEKNLYCLTSKGKYELLSLRFSEQMSQQKDKLRSGKYWVAIFDIPEEKRKCRDFFRHLLKSNGFKMWQYSVWVTPYNPNPAFNDLLGYLGLKNYFVLLEIDRAELTPNFRKKFKF